MVVLKRKRVTIKRRCRVGFVKGNALSLFQFYRKLNLLKVCPVLAIDHPMQYACITVRWAPQRWHIYWPRGYVNGVNLFNLSSHEKICGSHQSDDSVAWHVQQPLGRWNMDIKRKYKTYWIEFEMYHFVHGFFNGWIE